MTKEKSFVRIIGIHQEKGGFMFYSVMQVEGLCDSDPSLIFSLMKEGEWEVIENILDNKKIDLNTEDKNRNNIVMGLLKYKQYHLVLKYLDRVDINHQNMDGDTMMHMLSGINYVNIKEIIEYVLNKKDINLNIKNNLGETILDKAINNHYLYTTMKILENKNFNCIDIYSFKHLYEEYIKSDSYGKYSKLSNLEIILDNLENKRLLPRMKKLIYLIEHNKEGIKKEFDASKTEKLDHIINHVVMEVIN